MARSSACPAVSSCDATSAAGTPCKRIRSPGASVPPHACSHHRCSPTRGVCRSPRASSSSHRSSTRSPRRWRRSRLPSPSERPRTTARASRRHWRRCSRSRFRRPGRRGGPDTDHRRRRVFAPAWALAGGRLRPLGTIVAFVNQRTPDRLTACDQMCGQLQPLLSVGLRTVAFVLRQQAAAPRLGTRPRERVDCTSAMRRRRRRRGGTAPSTEVPVGCAGRAGGEDGN